MDIVDMYLELAELEEERGESQPRDRFFILAADAALARGDNERAEKLRSRLLELNPHHLLKPYASFADAIRSADVYGYVLDLRDSYPPVEAERLLASVRGGGPGAENEPFPRLAAGTPVSASPADPPTELPIFPLSRSAEPAVPAGPQEPAATARPSRKPSQALLELGADPVETGEVYPLPRRSAVPRRAREPHSVVSMWVSSLLFAVLLIAAVGLTTYTLARPFLGH